MEKSAVRSSNGDRAVKVVSVDWKRVYRERPDLKKTHTIMENAEKRAGHKISLSELAISLKES